jgi:AhpD family alkylhydroperoxidase
MDLLMGPLSLYSTAITREENEVMKPRIDYVKSAPGVYEAMDALDQYLAGCGLEKRLLYLVQLRASQINGCAYCLDMHWKDLRALGESEQRLYSLDAWRECPYYSERERAALGWTEAVTRIADGHAPDEVFAAARQELGERELCDLTLAVAAINAWNRLSIAARLVPGGYQPAPLVAAAITS